MTPPQDGRIWLTVTGAAEHLGLSTTTIRRMCDRGELPHFLMGKERRFTTLELDAWLEQHRAFSKDEPEPGSTPAA